MYFRSFGDDQIDFPFSRQRIPKTVRQRRSYGAHANLAKGSLFLVLESVLGSGNLAILRHVAGGDFVSIVSFYKPKK